MLPLRALQCLPLTTSKTALDFSFREKISAQPLNYQITAPI
jgi:hypothetical protein